MPSYKIDIARHIRAMYVVCHLVSFANRLHLKTIFDRSKCADLISGASLLTWFGACAKPELVAKWMTISKRVIRPVFVFALPPKADMCSALAHVCFGPKADMHHLIDQLVRAPN